MGNPITRLVGKVVVWGRDKATLNEPLHMYIHMHALVPGT